jgi:Na+/melibiose symporter-like transporter
MVFGTNALFVKPAISLSPMLAVAVLNRYGYSQIKKSTEKTSKITENPLSPAQLQDLKGAMFFLVCWYPIVIGIVQLISWSFYRIENKIEKKIEVKA